MLVVKYSRRRTAACAGISLRHRGFTLTEYTSRSAQEQPSSSTRYLVMRSENHWLASHQQHVRNMARVSPSLSVLRNLSLSACWRIGTSYDTTIHLIVALSSTTARSARVSRIPRDWTDDREKTIRSYNNQPILRIPIVAHREIFCRCFAVVTAPSCPFLETRSLSLPTFLSWLLLYHLPSSLVWTGLT